MPSFVSRLMCAVCLAAILMQAGNTALSQDPQPVEPRVSCGMPTVVDDDRLSVPVTATAPDVDAAESAGRGAAVRKALEHLVTDAAFSNDGWADAVKTHASVRLLKKVAVEGGVELKLQVEVNQMALLQWAAENQARVDLDLIPLALAGRAVLAGNDATAEEAMVAATMVAYLQHRGVQTLDYAMARENGGLADAAVGSIDVGVQPAGNGLVRVQVSANCVDQSTAESLARATGYSGSVIERQRTLAIANAARNAAAQLYLQLAATSARHAENGTPYALSVSGVSKENADKLLEVFHAQDANGRASLMLRGEQITGQLRFRGQTTELVRGLRDALSAAGFRMTEMQLVGRRVQFAVAPK